MHVSNFVVSSTDRIVVLCGLWILPEIGSWVNPYTICCVLLLLHILPILRLLRPGFDPGEAAARSFTCCFRVHRRLLDWRKLHYTLSVVPGTLTYLTHTEQNPLPCLSRKILIYKTLAHTVVQNYSKSLTFTIYSAMLIFFEDIGIFTTKILD